MTAAAPTTGGAGGTESRDTAMSRRHRRSAKTPRPRTERHPLAIEIGKRLRSAREAADLESHMVCELEGINRQTLSTWENGWAFAPLPRLLSLCRLYKVSIDYIVSGEQPHNWQSVAALMPDDLRARVFMIHRRPDVGELVPHLYEMDPEDLKTLVQTWPALSKLSGERLNVMKSLLDNLAEIADHMR